MLGSWFDEELKCIKVVEGMIHSIETTQEQILKQVERLVVLAEQNTATQETRSEQPPIKRKKT